MRSRNFLKVVDESVIHRCAAERADNRHGLRRELLGDHDAETGSDLRPGIGTGTSPNITPTPGIGTTPNSAGTLTGGAPSSGPPGERSSSDKPSSDKPPNLGPARTLADIKEETEAGITYQPCPANVRFPNGQQMCLGLQGFPSYRPYHTPK